MPGPSAIFDFLDAEAQLGHDTALVTVVSVTGASVRNPGAHMAVSTSGGVIGSLSGGCIEAAVVREALEAITAKAPRLLLYGAGSPVIDIRLPCGGTVELLVTPLAGAAGSGAARTALATRNRADFTLPVPDGRRITVTHAPRLRIFIYGHGATVEALAALAQAADVEVAILTPDAAICDRHPDMSTLLTSPTAPLSISSDPWTAHVFYFHDHDWETALLAAALGQTSLYVGAMGSLKTHAARSAALSASGVSEDDIARISAPIGLIPSSRDPETLALSTLAEIVAAYNDAEPTRVML